MDFNKIFHKVPVQVQNRSAFNCGHKNLFTADVGTLVPCLVDPLIPNTTIDLGFAAQVQLPPLATDFYGNIYAKMEVFWVPNRIVWAGWKQFMTTPTNENCTQFQSPANDNAPRYLPCASIAAGSMDTNNVSIYSQFFKVGQLADMLGYKDISLVSLEESGNVVNVNNLLPFLAYHKIYDDWYRDSRLQQPVFPSQYGNSNISTTDWRYAPYRIGLTDGSYSVTTPALFTLHQRNWQRDYFTNSTPLPQAGLGSELKFDVTDGEGSFTIAALRAANSLQQWFERNNIAGERYADQIKARFGCYPSDAITDRAIYLGSKTFQVYSKSVYETVDTNNAGSSPNIFRGQLGSKATNASGFGEDTLVSNYTVTEHGHLMVIFSLVPEVLYGSGTRRYLSYKEITDFPDPLLQGVGDQPVYQFEVDGGFFPLEDVEGSGIFGYTQRFAEAKFMNDEVHGLLRDGQNLSAFALQRTIKTDREESNGAQIGSDFIEIPKDYLDQVSNVNSEVSQYGCWVECYFRYNKVAPLAAYSIPTLGDPRDTHTEIIDNGGTRL